MVAPAATLPHVSAIIATLAGAAITAYHAEAGKDVNGVRVSPPYVVIYPSGGNVRSTADSDRGTLADANRDADLSFQTTAVGTTADQALNVHDRTVAALLGASPTVSGRTTVKPIVLAEEPQPVQRDDGPAESLFYVVARWTWRTAA